MTARSWQRVCAVLVLASSRYASAANAQSTAPNPFGNSDEKFELRGTVVNAADGTPVRMALVRLQAEKFRTVLTGPDGSFQFQGLPPTEMTLTAHKPGYFSPQEFRPESLGEQRVRVGPSAPTAELRLYPESVIYGRVTDENNRPLEGMMVRVVRLGTRNRTATRGDRPIAVTNEDGEYRVADLKPGSYLVVVSRISPRNRTRFGTGRPSAKHDYPTYFHPGVTDAAAATPVRVGMGKQAQADLRLAKQPLFRVSGRLSGITGEGPCSVFMMSPYDVNPVGMTNVVQGLSEFVLDAVPAGTYVLGAVQTNGRSQPKTGIAHVAINRDLDNVSITLGELARIQVRYHRQFEQNGASVQQSGLPSIHFVREDLLLGDADRAPNVFNQNESTEAEYEMQIEPGVFRAEVTNQESQYVAALTSGSINLLRDDLVIDAGSRAEPIDVVVRNDGGVIRGTVLHEGRPAQGRVLLIPELAPRLARSAPTTVEGRFEARGLGPGRYLAVVLDDADDLVAGDPETLRQVQSLATVFELEPHGSATIELPLKRLQP